MLASTRRVNHSPRRRASDARSASHSKDTCTSSGVHAVTRSVSVASCPSSTSRSRRPSRHRRVPSRSSLACGERSRRDSSRCVAHSRS
jgi:hypothetical protein